MKKESVSILSTLVNLLLGASKLAVGFMINSAALLADGVHSGLDFISSLSTYLGIKVAKKPVDEKHPYGYYLAETISGGIVILLLAASAFWIIFEGAVSLLEKEVVQVSLWGFIVIVASIILNELMARLKFKYGQKEQSLALVADAQHSRADVISSLGVLAALFLVKYFSFADGLIAILIGGYILKESYFLGREVIDNLLGVKDEKTEEAIKEHLREKNISLTSLKTRKIGAATFAEITIKLAASLMVKEAEKISKTLQNDLISKIKNLKYVVIQIESHDISQGLIRAGWGWGGRQWGSRGRFKSELKTLGPKKQGYRIVVSFKEGKFYPDFGAPEYLLIDKRGEEIIKKQIIKNPHFETGGGHGVRFVKSTNPDEVITQRIGFGAKERLEELGIKLTLIKEAAELKDLIK